MTNLLRTRRTAPHARWLFFLLAAGLSFQTASGQRTAGEPEILVTTQPARIEPYEQTPLFAKVQGFVQKTRLPSGGGSDSAQAAMADIGDEVSEGEVLAEIDVPEMLQELEQKKALAEQAAAELLQATAAVTVADKAIDAVRSRVAESQAGVIRAKGEYARWNAQHERIRQLAEGLTVTEKLVDETLNQLRAAEAGRDEAEARVIAVEAEIAETQARFAKAKADESVARVRVRVAASEVGRLEALLGYTRIRSPFAGIISQRNIDTGHFVQPGMASQLPLFVVERIDTLRVAVDIPEREAVHVRNGNPAWIQIPALGQMEFESTVARTSWVLDPASRTLRVEIDLPNPERRFRPGMYARARVALSSAPDLPKSN